MKVAVVGATGLVGKNIVEILLERRYPFEEILLCSTERSVGKTLEIRGNRFNIISVDQILMSRPDLVFFAVSNAVASDLAPKFLKVGATIVDNSSRFRMTEGVPLVIPEINGVALRGYSGVIANPNCSTIQMCLALEAFRTISGIRRIVVSTYQSVSGSGTQGIQQLMLEEKGKSSEESPYPNRIHNNAIPQCDIFLDDGYTKEEHKLMQEPKKIWQDWDLELQATAVRIPTYAGHSESIMVEVTEDIELQDVFVALRKQAGILVLDDPSNEVYPTPLQAFGNDEVLVGRLRRDRSSRLVWHLWCCADNVRKGAALNAVQIAERWLMYRS